MKVKRVVIRGYKCLKRFQADFNPVINLMVGVNGSGKTTVLDVIAGMSGSDFATKLIAHKEVEYASILLEHLGKEYSLQLQGWFHEDQIEDFKRRLPERTSYVVRELDDYRFTAKIDDGIKNQERTFEWLEMADMPLTPQNLYVSSNKASLLVSERGAQRNMLNIGFRLAPPEVPMLLDGMEQSLHVSSRRLVLKWFYRADGQQLIGTSHCPEIVIAAEALAEQQGIERSDAVFSMETLDR